MAFQDWDKAADGSTVTCPLVGFETVRYQTAALVRLMFVQSEDQLKRGQIESVQLSASPGPIRELGQALIRMADEIDRLPLGTRQ